MPETSWHIEGDYFETCNCDFLCPCIHSNMAATPTKGDCRVAMAFRISNGRFDQSALDDLCFIVVTLTPGPMIDGNWTVGVIIDAQADEDQSAAIAKIVSGDVGGPPAMMAPFIGTFAGVETRPIHFSKSGLTYSVSVPELLEQGVEGLPTFADPEQAIVIDNTAHPANSRLALAKATHSRLHAFGIDWEDASGQNNGHFAPFHWQSD